MSQENKLQSNFPKNFLWGAATSAHQVEGNNHNDWSEWEKSDARRKQLEKSGLINPPIGGPPAGGGIDNFISGAACDHYNRYEEDFDIAKSLGHNAHRFSIEWSRIEPEEGKFNQTEIEHYRSVIRALHQRGLEPFVTLWHFTFPIWLKNGWLNPKSSFYFSRFVQKIVSELGDDVKFWITINEPITYSASMYLGEKWIYNQRSFLKYMRQISRLVKVHKEAYKTIKKINPDFQVGIAKNNNYFTRLVWWCPFEWGIARVLRCIKNEWFLNKIKNYQDFIGLNYYREIKVDPTFGFFDKHPILWKEPACNVMRSISGRGRGVVLRNNMGWRENPEGIYHLLIDLKKYNKPVYITENGTPTENDDERAEFIKNHLHWVSRAIKDGADVRGYFHWSLLDNFEWAHGFWPKFGLVEVDRKTMKRKIKKSAYAYKEIICLQTLD